MTDEQDPHEGMVVFEVETLTAGVLQVGYQPEDAMALANDLDRATTIVACPEGHSVMPITGGIPRREMPRCARCDREAVGVVEITVVSVPDEGGDEN